MTSRPTILIKSTPQNNNAKKSFVKLGNNIVINKIPTIVKPAMKRNAIGDIKTNNTKFPLHTITSSGTPITGLQWQTIANAKGTTITTGKKQNLETVIGTLPPNTTIQAKNTGQILTTINSRTIGENNEGTITTVTPNAQFKSITSQPTTIQIKRPTVFIKREMPPAKTIRDITVEMIEKNPMMHLGLPLSRLNLFKTIVCESANVSLNDCYLTLKKIRQNEDFTILGEYFQLSDLNAQQIFTRTIVRLARFLKYLIRWPDSKKYYDRHKNLPFAYRSQLFNVQSMVDCVETEIETVSQIECYSYKYILCMTPNGVITYISDAFLGYHDDLSIFSASKFREIIPKYLSLVVEPGKAVRKKLKRGTMVDNDSTTDSADEFCEELNNDKLKTPINKYMATKLAGEFAAFDSMSVCNNELISRKVKDFSVPTVQVRNNICRNQLREMLDKLREFRILQPYGIKEPISYMYINEILVCSAALVNLQQ